MEWNETGHSGGRLKVVSKVVGQITALLLVSAAMPVLYAQGARAVLTGHMRAGVVAANDRGEVDASLTLRHVTLILQPSAAQQADLADLLTRQQNPSSPDFHRWLTPEQYGARFGLAQSDIGRITSWLASQNMSVDSVGRGRTTIAFTGTVRDVEKAFQTEIHRYRVNGELHFSNASEPSVPAAIGGLIQAIHGLDDFHPKPMARQAAPPIVQGPSYTSVTTGNHYLAPEDVATIFDIAPLYNSGITGKGQTIVVVGQTQINLSDIEEFRTYFNLSANDPQLLLVPHSEDPGISNSDLSEADLDLEWSGAIARDASVIYVYSTDVDTSLDYAINQNLAPVITMSYGLCEGLESRAELSGYNTYAQQASAQGISWISSAGDNGGNDCFGESSNAPSGLAVDSPASTPGVTGVGGTTLTEGGGTYWNQLNDANHASAISYIPESVWNDSAAEGSPDAGGGGASSYFPKPVWQTGPGVPADNARDVPDIAMPASNYHDAYLVYTGGSLEAFGGTSVGAPVFAGVAGLLNQYLVANGLQTTPGQGSMNPRLYALAQTSAGVFHDVTVGNNMVESCAPGARGCSGTLVGYNAGPGYDQASGWGSVDAFNLVTAWSSSSATSAKTAAAMQLTSSLSLLSATDTTALTATVTTSSGATPTGTITFYVDGVSLGAVKVTGSGLMATATLSATAAQLSVGTPETTGVSDPLAGAVNPTVFPALSPAVTAIYSGDAVYEPASASAIVLVLSPSAMVLTGTSSAASFKLSYAPGMIMSIFGQNLSTSTPIPPGSPLPTQLGGTTVTINGIPAPLYYVSPAQINLQVPYAIPGNSSAIVKVSANGQTATSQFPVSNNAPEVFADSNSLLVPYQTTGRGQTIFLFASGDGLLTTPALTTGSVPAGGTVSAPTSSVRVTVGGVAGTTVFAGVPSWSIGVTQINFTIPANAPLGLQPVVVTVGNSSSAPVFITVTP